MPQTRTPERLTLAHQRRLTQLKRAAVAAALAAFDRLGGYDEAAQAEFVATVVPLLLAGQSGVVAQVDAYYSAAAGAITGTSSSPIGIDPAQIIGAKARQGVALETVYRRPLWDWHRRQEALAQLDSRPMAQRSTIGRERSRLYARSRIAKDIITDMQLVQRDAAWARAQVDPRLPMWRRVLNGDSCALCVTAASNTYARIRRIQIHPGCDCGIEPVGDSGVMALPNLKQLPDVYRQLNSEVRRGTGISKAVDPTGPVTLYRDQLNITLPDDLDPVEVVSHGELGPLLWVQGHEFSDN